MRYFQREPLSPSIQRQLSSKTSTEFNLTDAQRRDIIKKLLSSQKSICAYCECLLMQKKVTNKRDEINFHIEHFEEQHDTPLKVFHYSNYLLSCDGDRHPVSKPEDIAITQSRKANISCGYGKENSRHNKVEINYSLLLNPTDNVSTLFSYENGVVEPSKICSPNEAFQVKYTIKRLNLDAERLEKARINQIELVIEDLIPLTEDMQKPIFAVY